MAFLLPRTGRGLVQDSEDKHLRDLSRRSGYPRPPPPHTHTQPSFSPIDNRKNDRFTKTGSGHTQTQNIHSKRTLKKGGWLLILAEIRSLINEEVRKRLFGAILY